MTSLKTSFFLAVILTLSPVILKAQNKAKPKSPVATVKSTVGTASGRKPASTTPTSVSAPAPAPTPQAGAPRGLSAGGGEAKALEVRGQARSLQMMMLLKGKGDDIHFVKPRKDFRPEVNTTTY